MASRIILLRTSMSSVVFRDQFFFALSLVVFQGWHFELVNFTSYFSWPF